MAGLEPANEGVKVPCLTAWLHPYWEERAGIKSHPSLFVGWVKGLEPSTPGTTIRCSNQLSYTHHMDIHMGSADDEEKNGTPEGTRTPGLLLRRQLLYPTELLARICQVGAGDGNRTRIPSLEGWCPGHCATPAFALRKDRQLCYNSISVPFCQHFFRNSFGFLCYRSKADRSFAPSTASLRANAPHRRSGCHCTAKTGSDSCAIASTVPSGAQARTCSPSPKVSTA